METPYIKSTTEAGICSIEFFHPKSNSLPSELLKELAEKIKEAGDNVHAKVIILRSPGKTFCAGASFDELLSIEDFETGKKFFMGFMQVINAIRTVPKFVIARVQGKAVGGGVGLVAAADYALGVDESSVKLSEYALSIGPFVVGPAVERKIGSEAFSHMSIDTEWRDSLWARQKGLFAETFETIEELDENLEQLAARLAKNSPEATKELKKIFWEGTENWDSLLEERAEISGRLVLSDFTKEYIKKFKDK
jgi:methylglutaconyl-CoA hydratase